jgi:hypothetical protein
MLAAVRPVGKSNTHTRFRLIFPSDILSRSEQVTLPGVNDLLAGPPGGFQPVRQPQYYRGQYATLPTSTHAQFPETHAPIHYGYPHASIEVSTPPASFSSPHGMFNDIGSDSSSNSSGSRDSSAYPSRSVSSTTAVNGRSTRSTRTKRGSESQGSGSDRSTKRPDSSKGELWCTDCECAVANCSDRKVHKARVKKIVKEKSSRSSQAAILQCLEDLVQTVLNIIGLKVQQPGNKKKSGMLYDKKQVLMSALIFLDTLLQAAADSGVDYFNAVAEEARSRIQNHFLDDSTTELYAGSVMSGPKGESPCLHQHNRVKSDVDIERRKSRRAMHIKNNLKRRMSSAARPTSR